MLYKTTDQIVHKTGSLKGLIMTISELDVNEGEQGS